MPRPRPRTAFPTAAAVAAQGLSVDQVDPDHLSFLQHVLPDGNFDAVDLPARGAYSPVTDKYEAGAPTANGEAQGNSAPFRAPAGGDRVAGQQIPPADALPWYETAAMDEEYRKFWRQTRMEGGRLVLQVGEDKILRYELDAVPVRLCDIAGGAEKKRGKKVAAVAALGEDGDGVGDEDEEKEKIVPIRMVGPPLNPSLDPSVRDSLGRWQKKKVEQGQQEKGEGRKGGARKIKEVNREDKKLNELPLVTVNAVNRETNSSNGHDVELQTALGFCGVVWPTHIMERPESSFKGRLLGVLRKPFSMAEYKELLDEATNRRPATKSRETRRGVKYYDSAHEVNQSYFDSNPDLEEQVRSTCYLNQLALLRGFFFWLKNVTDDDQFRPWRDDFRQYSIIPYE